MSSQALNIPHILDGPPPEPSHECQRSACFAQCEECCRPLCRDEDDVLFTDSGDDRYYYCSAKCQDEGDARAETPRLVLVDRPEDMDSDPSEAGV